MGSELYARAEVAQALAIARQMLEGVALSLGQLPAGAPSAPWVASVSAILAGLERLDAPELDDHAVLKRVASASGAADRLATQLRSEGTFEQAESIARRLDAVARQLDECRSRGIDALVARPSAGTVANARTTTAAAEEHFRASVGTAALQRLVRAPMALWIEDASDRAEAGDAAEAGPAKPGGATPSADGTRRASEAVAPTEGAVAGLDSAETRHCESLARDCLSDLAALSNLRMPLDQMVWSLPESFEERLLANLDALLALGLAPGVGREERFDLLDAVQRYAADTPTADVGREFARTIALCSVTGQDAVRAALLAARQAAPAAYPGFRDALCLAPHPDIGEQVGRTLGAGGQARWLATAIEVLRFRREVSFAALLPLTAHPHPSVVAAAVRGLGFVPETAPAIELLFKLAGDEDDELVIAEAATSLLLLGSLDGLRLARAHLVEPALLSDRARVGFLRILALAGDGSDRALVESAAERTARDVQLVGWYGHAELVPWLMAVLAEAHEQGEAQRPIVPALEHAAARALERITGAGLHDEPNDRVAYDFVTEPSLDPDAWRRWWTDHGGELDADHKLRTGKPFSPGATVAELAGPSVCSDRADGALEVALLHGRSAFEPTDWIARQRTILLGLASVVGREPPYPPGRWPAQVLADRARAGWRRAGPEGAATGGPASGV